MGTRLHPIIIIGAGRSGTKLLRRVLDKAPGTVAFPHEINYIWRFGNARYPTDELLPKHARPEVVSYIRNRFRTWSNKNNQSRVIEKTCANSLRVDFVYKVFPDAHFIHLIRDGRAVVESACRRWKASPRIPYLLEKFRWVPIRDMPYYFLRFLNYQLGRFSGDSEAMNSWGPRFEGMDQVVREKSLIEVCALQWKKCVRASSNALNKVPQSQVTTVIYEDFVKNPIYVLKGFFDRAGLEFTDECEAYIMDHVSVSHIDKWRDRLNSEEMDLVMDIIEDELRDFEYLPEGLPQNGEY
ncbi:MAG: sulfotransferase [Candidatus Thorarchaeota archaeon]|jgi:hypothetical protein